METLLKAIQSAIKNDLNLAELKGQIYIVPEGLDEFILTDEARLPFVTLKDFGEQIQYLPAKRERIVRVVQIAPYLEFMETEKQIIGDNVRQGLIKIVRLLKALLLNNFLNVPGVMNAKITQIEHIIISAHKGRLVVKKAIQVSYTIHQ